MVWAQDSNHMIVFKAFLPAESAYREEQNGDKATATGKGRTVL